MDEKIEKDMEPAIWGVDEIPDWKPLEKKATSNANWSCKYNGQRFMGDPEAGALGFRVSLGFRV